MPKMGIAQFLFFLVNTSSSELKKTTSVAEIDRLTSPVKFIAGFSNFLSVG
jgi:hypothetical protein